MNDLINDAMKGIASGLGIAVLACVVYVVHKVRVRKDKNTTLAESGTYTILILGALAIGFVFLVDAWGYYSK